MIFSGKEVRVILSAEATEQYNELNRIVGNELQQGINSSLHQSIFKSIERVISLTTKSMIRNLDIKESNYFVLLLPPALYLLNVPFAFCEVLCSG